MQPEGDRSTEVLRKSDVFQNSISKRLEKIQNRIAEKIILRDQTKKIDDWKSIETCLKNHFVFYNLTDKELQNIRDHMLQCSIEQGEFVYETGDSATCFFIVKTGILELLVDDKFKNDIRPHDGFGQIALLYKTQRTSSVRAREKSELWVIDRLTFRQAVEESIIEEYTENRKCLQGARFFWGLTKEQKDIIAASLIVKKFKKNQIIVKEGDPGSSYYYIKQGTASVFKGSKFIRKLFKGDSFGEQSLYYNTMRQLTIKVDDEIICLILGRDTLNRVMGQQIYEVTFKNFIRWAFDNNNLLQRLTKDQTEKFIDNMKISNYKVNQTIFRRGVVGFQKVVVVIEGQLKNVKNGSIVASKGECYGEEYFLYEKRQKTMDDEIIMQSYGVLAELTDLTLIQSMGLHNMNTSTPEMNLSEGLLAMIQKSKINERYNKGINLNNTKVVKKITDGQFGGIYLINEEDNYYCMKRYSKLLLEEYDVSKFIQNQPKLSFGLISFFVTSIIKTFHTINSAYYITQFVQGEDLYDVMKTLGLLSSEDSKFYAANIILILQHLHEMSIIVRDIKPDNFMVDKNGFLKLMNLSIAKKTQKEKRQIFKTYTIIGTPHYMAPDIILGKGYNNMVDLWSLGVTIYEFLCGFLPFGDQAEGAYEIYEEIMQNEVKFPDFFTDKKAKNFIQQLLSHNPDSRLNGSFMNLKNDLWLQTINWQAIISKVNTQKIHIPYVPSVRPEKHKFEMPLLYFLKEQERKEKPFKGKIENQWEKFGEFLDF